MQTVVQRSRTRCMQVGQKVQDVDQNKLRLDRRAGARLGRALQARDQGQPPTGHGGLWWFQARLEAWCLCVPRELLWGLLDKTTLRWLVVRPLTRIEAVVQSFSRVWLCNPMDYSMPGLPVLHHFLEPAQTHVHWVSDAIPPLESELDSSPVFTSVFK